MAHDEKHRAEAFKSRLAEARKTHDKWSEQWRSNDEVYHGEARLPKTTQDILRSRIRVPWAWQQIETLVPRLVIPDPKFEFQPVEGGDRRMSDVLNALLRWQLKADRFVTSQRPIILDAMINGIGVAKVVWKRKTQEVYVRRPQTTAERILRKSPDPKKESRVVENRPAVVYVDPFDFFPDPAARSDGDWRYVFHRSWKTKREIERLQEKGIYKPSDKLGMWETDYGQRGIKESPEEAEARRAGRYPVYEGWFDDGTRMVMCGDVVLLDDENPYWHGQIPFCCFSTQPDPRSIVGISEVEKIAALQEAIWTRDNQRIDAVNLALAPVFVMDPTITGWRHFTFRPGTKIPANSSQRIEQLPINPNSAPAFAETEAYLSAMQHVTGASPYLAGASPGAFGVNQETATGASILQEEGNKRLELKRLEYNLFLARLAKMIVQLNHQYLSEFEIHRIIGDEAVGYKPPAPEEIPMFLDVIPEALSESLSKANERSEVNELINITGPMHMVPMADGTVYDVKPLLESALKLYGKEPRLSFQTPPPMEAPLGPESSAGAPVGPEQG